VRTAILAAAALGTLLPSLALAQNCPAGVGYPGADWTDRTAEVRAAKPDAVKALEDWAFTLTGKDEERLGLRTDGLVVVQDGQVLFEKYGRGFTRDNRHLLWSTTKTITGMLAGVAVQQGVLSVDDSVCKHRPDLSAACDLTVRNLLEMASGLDWAEEYEDGQYQQSSVLAMLYGQGREAVVPFVASHPRKAAPGTRFNYSTGESHLLMGVVRAALKPTHGDEFPWTLLMDRLGVTSFTLERDPTGDFHGGSFGYLTPRDMARFGTLMLNDGCWTGERILPEGWMASARTVNTPFKVTPLTEDTAYGWQIWLNQAVPENGLELPYPDAPLDTFMAAGHWGQYIIVVPSMRLVIARTGDDRKSVPHKINDLIKYSLPLAGVPQ
jgi:CubicO group peptidase (beta-lactamase class C family)